LIGSATGPFLALILSAFAFYCKEKHEKRKKIKEGRVRIEVGITRSLNEVLLIQSQLRYTSALIRKLVVDIRNVKNPNEVALNTVNFPITGDAYRDPEMPHVKTKSYYLHNKLLFLDRALRDLGDVLDILKEDFKDLITLNRMMSDKMPPANQRATYSANLEAFADTMDIYSNKEFLHVVKLATEIKLYNEMMSKHPFFTRIRYEKSPYLFSPKRTANAIRDLSAVDRIDDELRERVEKEVARMDQKNIKRNPVPN
jgi:hypothetical protein